MERQQGIAHTIEVSFFVSREFIGENINLKKFTRKEKKNVYNLEESAYKTTIVFRGNKQTFIYIKIDLFKLLNYSNINELQYHLLNDLIREYISITLSIDSEEHLLIRRIDYCCDFKTTELERKLILDILHTKSLSEAYEYKRAADYETTVYYNSYRRNKINIGDIKKKKNKIGSSKTLRIYDKAKEQNFATEQYKDTLRFEITLRSKHLRYKKHRDGFSKTLETYLKEVLFLQYFINEYSKILYTSDFYRIDVARTAIINSNLTPVKEEKLIKFINDISKYNLNKVRENLTRYNLSKSKFTSYITSLEKIGLNPITLNGDCPLEKLENPVRIMLLEVTLNMINVT